MAQTTLISLHPNDTLKDNITIHFQLISIDVWEIVIFLMIYPIKYVFQTKQKI